MEYYSLPLVDFFILNHMLSCIWTFVATLSYPNWIVDQNLTDASDLDVYIAAFFFNLTTIYTIGYGNITSQNMHERVYNIIVMVVGIMLYSYIIVYSYLVPACHPDQITRVIPA